MAIRKHYHADRPTHDIWLYENAGQWQVRERIGGPSGNSRYRPFASGELAETFARSLMNKSAATAWRELPVDQTAEPQA